MIPGIALRRSPFVFASILLLLVGMWGGLLRLGWNFAGPAASVPYHGPLMIGGFLGTLISLERAVALGHPWVYGAPLAAALGAIAILVGLPLPFGQGLLALASVLLFLAMVLIFFRQREVFIVVMTLGALAWLAGNLLWLFGRPVSIVVPLWAAFLVLTIVGERLELSRFLPFSHLRLPTFNGVISLYLLGLLLTIWLPGLGLGILGFGQLLLAQWLFTFDLARHTIRRNGLPRFTAACLLTGYFWLALSGALSLYYGLIWPAFVAPDGWLLFAPSAGLIYDAILHSLLLGFVIGMIFGHAPIIFPAVMRIRITYRPRFYSHLALLQISVALRVASDLAGSSPGRKWAGTLNVITLLLFLLNTITSVRFPNREQYPPRDDKEFISLKIVG